MKEAIMYALIFFIFASQVLHIFAKVTVLRGPLLSKNPDKVKLICLSEDDGGALVWNYHLIWKYPYFQEKNDFEFRNLNGINNNEINCKMNANEGCLASWTKHGWSLTNSIKTPMGLIFDQRWEEFKQYENFEDTYNYLDLKFSAEVTFSFSVRASRDVHILLCNGKEYHTDYCYWIIIGGWDNTKSVIRKCVMGVPKPGKAIEIDSQCQKAQVSKEHSPLSDKEWRSFIIAWDSVTRTLNVYDTYNIIMTYIDKEEHKLSNNNYHMFLRSNTKMLFRSHKYNFLHTTVENAFLTSPVFRFNNETICVQLLIGLCAECDARVVLRDFTNNKVLEEVTVEGSSKFHGLPIWQSVKIKSNSIHNSYNRVIIQLIPKLNDDSSNPLWAIANIRQCPQNEALRRGVMISSQDWEKQRDYFWPNVSCQKLFYDEHAVVYATSLVKPDINLNDTNCPQEKIGPQCLFSCELDLGTKSDCKGTKICHEHGCTCAPGFLGNSCSKSCESNTYGHSCKKTCGSCLYKTLSKEQCNKVTGECNYGCNNTKNIYIPPLCQTTIDKPNTPVITFTDKTTIWALVFITWKDEYEKISIFYSFTIKGQNKYYNQDERLFRNMIHLIGHFKDLEPGSTYEIRCNLRFANVTIHSDWEITETECIPAENFDITSEENSIIINWQINPNQLYLCAANWYYLKVRNVNTDELIVSKLATSFPYKLQHLPSYTSFNVTIFHENNMLFSQEIRTLEAAVPSKVLDLRSMLSANTQLTLTWRSLHQPNEEIVRYKVILKVKEYYGCKNLKLPTPDNHVIIKFTTETTITIPDLHPYTSYSAQVILNSRHFNTSAEIDFETAESEVPSEMFSQLRVQNWILSWLPPEDCSTISGPLKARIKIQGISDAVKYFNVTKQTTSNFLYLDQINPKLNGAEQYIATVYVIRDYTSKENISAYQKFEFETLPTAPPNVSNLEVVETDTRQTPAMIHLRWQSPLPPLNGKLRDFGVQLNDIYSGLSTVIQVQLNESCDLWDDYICKVVKEPYFYFLNSIQVFAYNVNVSEPGLSVPVTEDMLSNTTPDAPGNYTFTVNDNSVVDLKWLHPWKTGGHLKSFRIRIVETSSNLTMRFSRSATNKTYEYPVIQYMRNYSERLYLFSSTQYSIYIQAVTVENKSSTTQSVEVNTPSTAGFDGDLDVIVDKSNSILLNIPFVINDTQNSMMHIIVKGPTSPCEQYMVYSKVPENLRARAAVKMGEFAWQAAEVLTNDLAGKRFRVGDNKFYGNARNCPLKPKQVYEIMIIITERKSSIESIMFAKSIRIGDSSNPTKYIAWLIPIILFFVITFAAIYLYRRKRQKRIEQLEREMDSFQRIGNYEQETTLSVIWNSKQDLSISSDRQSLSQATTSEVPQITNGEREEMKSLVKVKDFEDYVRKAIQSGLLDQQYKTFSRGQTRAWDYGKLPQNKFKNRYEKMIAYDETRVILKKLPNDTHSDYINANYITNYKKEKRYIATQGPKPNTIIDFWRMIWQENVFIICMLVNLVENGRTKCEQYWPNIGKKKKYGDINVLNAKQNVFADYCFRTFYITCGGKTRKIEHLHYTAWPEHGVPLYIHSIVTYLKKLRATPPGDGPIVVHCNAGVGRTGTIILCDICLCRAAAEELVDVFVQAASITSERANMMDNKQQYLLAHLVLMECFFSISTTLSCDGTLTTRIKQLKNQLSIQQQRLQNTVWQDDALRQVASTPPLSEHDRAKNKFAELISNKVNKLYLRYPASSEDIDNIYAVYVAGIKLQNQYLATQLPMPSTVNNFWRMIAEFKVELILMLQPPDFQDLSCCVIAPASGKFKPISYLNIAVIEVVDRGYYTSQKLLLVDNSEKSSREQSVTILCLTEWEPGKNQPLPSVMMMVTFWQDVEKIAKGDGPIVTLCHDGVTGCGLYLALSFLLERMAVERECDVYLAVRVIKRSRSDFIRSLEHLEYLYDAAMIYSKYL